jgi:hypothetical protein
MTAWTRQELNTIGAAHELELTTLRSDGTPRKPVRIWVVRSGDDLDIRSWRGRTAAWFRSAQARRQGHIRAGGIDRDVLFVDPPRTSTTSWTLPIARSTCPSLRPTSSRW